MAISNVPNLGGPGISPVVGPGREKFGKLLAASSSQQGGELAIRARKPDAHVAKAEAGKAEVGPGSRIQPAQQARAEHAVKVLDQVTAAQQRLDRVLQLAQSGKSFTPAELIALQANVYRASQELDLAGKVVEKATSGVKQVLQTQI